MEINVFDAKKLLSKKLEKMPKFGKQESPLFLVSCQSGEIMQLNAGLDDEIPSCRFGPDYLFRVDLGNDEQYEITLCP